LFTVIPTLYLIRKKKCKKWKTSDVVLL
jgi:hypothetical protein